MKMFIKSLFIIKIRNILTGCYMRCAWWCEMSAIRSGTRFRLATREARQAVLVQS